MDLRRDELESISSVKFPSKMSVLAETGDLKEELAYLERIPLDMLNEIIAATLRRLHIDVDDQTVSFLPLQTSKSNPNTFIRRKISS